MSFSGPGGGGGGDDVTLQIMLAEREFMQDRVRGAAEDAARLEAALRRMRDEVSSQRPPVASHPPPRNLLPSLGAALGAWGRLVRGTLGLSRRSLTCRRCRPRPCPSPQLAVARGVNPDSIDLQAWLDEDQLAAEEAAAGAAEGAAGAAAGSSEGLGAAVGDGGAGTAGSGPVVLRRGSDHVLAEKVMAMEDKVSAPPFQCPSVCIFRCKHWH